MKVIPTLEAGSEKELLTQNFENLVSKISEILQSPHPLDALQMGALENDLLFSWYEGFEKVLNLTAELAPEDKLEVLQILRDGQEISEETYGLLSSAWAAMFSSVTIATETAKVEDVVEIRNRAYETAKNLVKEGVVEIPPAELEAVRRDMMRVKELNEEVFNQLRAQIGSAILFRAEGKSQLNVAKALRLVEILFGQKQEKLTRNIFLAYKTLVEKTGFTLRFREGDLPAFNPGTINLVRNKLDAWFQQDQSETEKKEAEALLFSIDSFLIGISRKNNPTRAADLTYQRKMRAGIRQVLEIDEFVQKNLMPKDIIDLLNFTEGEIEEVNSRLVLELSKASTVSFAESKAYLQDLQFLSHRRDALHQEIIQWVGLNEEALTKELTLSTTNVDRLVKYLELEIKHLQGEMVDLQNKLDQPNLGQRETDKIDAAIGAIDWRMRDISKLRDTYRLSASPLAMAAKAGQKEVYELR